ncbi:MAG: GIY-YIG nuclease family protein [Ignavibacteriaceae bacterium]|nr:GIY-YIG nuclease family protein [Ignavibacteriaceae bacterium]
MKSKSTGKYYIGQTKDLQRRLQYHNAGYNKSTKGSVPWELVYYEEYSTRSKAVRRENYVKKMKSKEFIVRIIKRGERPD